MHCYTCFHLVMIKLDDKLYTSSEVADILGVSLRSVYRYIEESKLVPEVKTATGRHRFTKQNIIDFLYPNGEEPAAEISRTPVQRPVVQEYVQREKPVQPVRPVFEEKARQPVKEVPFVSEREMAPEAEAEPVAEPIDWLAKFREAARKFEESTPAPIPTPTPVREVREQVSMPSAPTFARESFTGFSAPVAAPTEERLYFRSRLGGLKDIAQNIDKTSRNSGLSYAFTLSAGLSLYKAIKPFSMLHVYVKNKDKDFYERVLMLTPSDENNAQLCLIVADESSIYDNRDELHGLYVVAKNKLSKDIKASADDSLIDEAQSIIG